MTDLSSSGVVPSVTVVLNVFMLSQKIGRQAVLPRAWGVSLSAGGGAMLSSLCITAKWEIPVYLWVLE